MKPFIGHYKVKDLPTVKGIASVLFKSKTHPGFTEWKSDTTNFLFDGQDLYVIGSTVVEQVAGSSVFSLPLYFNARRLPNPCLQVPSDGSSTGTATTGAGPSSETAGPSGDVSSAN